MRHARVINNHTKTWEWSCPLYYCNLSFEAVSTLNNLTMDAQLPIILLKTQVHSIQMVLR